MSHEADLHKIIQGVPFRGLAHVFEQIDTLIATRRMVPIPGASFEALMYNAGQVKALEDLKEILKR